MAEAKQTNFRINQEAADAFRKYCEDNGWNQAQGFDHLIEILELNQAKATMPNQSTDIEQFEMYQKKMLEAFLHNLSITAETEERIREEFRTALDQKDQTIRDLQEKAAAQAQKLEDAKSAKDKAEADAKDIQNKADEAVKAANKDADQARKTADDAQALADKNEKINTMLTSKLAEAEDKLTGYDDLRKSEEHLQNQVSDLSHQLELERAEGKHKDEAVAAAMDRAQKAEQKTSEQAQTIDKLKDDMAAAKQAAADAQKDADRKLSDAKQSFDKALSDATKDAELHEIKALDALRTEFNEQIQKLREEKAGLQARLAVLEDQAGKKN